jgi:hypothetical protein
MYADVFNVAATKDGEDEVLKSWGSLMYNVLPPVAETTIPLLLANVNVPPPETEPEPVVPDRLIVVDTEVLDADVNLP